MHYYLYCIFENGKNFSSEIDLLNQIAGPQIQYLIEKLNILNNTRLLNDSANFQINIDYNFKNDDIDPKILQLDAQRFFVDINKKELDNLFRIKVETKNYDWFRSRQYYLGYILTIIISILVSIFFTSNKTKKKL